MQLRATISWAALAAVLLLLGMGWQGARAEEPAGPPAGSEVRPVPPDEGEAGEASAGVEKEPLVGESSHPPKPEPTLLERVRVYGEKIPREVEQRAREFPEALRNFPRQVGELPERMGDLIHEVPFPGAPPVKERPKGWARQFFLELPEKEMEEAEGFGLIPELGYSQETDFLFGLAFGIGSLLVPHDNIQVGLASTTRNQQRIKLRYIAREFYTEHLRLELFAGGRRWISAYYGEGNDTQEADRDYYHFNDYSTRVGIWVNLPGYLRVGGLFGAEEWWIKEATFQPGGPFFVPGRPNGVGGGGEIFLGGGAAFDTRDNEFFPNKGILLEGRARRTDRALGADFDYMRVTADARAFWTLWAVGNVIALRGYLAATFSGTPPFFLEPQIGGDTFSRGYFQGRFRDRNALVASAEYRFPIYGRLNGALFGEFGQVASEIHGFEADRFKPTGGAAIGYLIPPGKVLLVRLEVAASEDGATFFLRFDNPF